MATTSPDNFPYFDEGSPASINAASALIAGAVQEKVGPFIVNTGWTPVTATAGVDSSGVFYAKTGKIVHIRVRDLIRASGSGTITAFTIPTAVAPDLEINPILERTGGVSPGHEIWLASNGQFRASFMAGQRYRGIFSYYKA